MAESDPTILDPAPMRARRDAFYARTREAMFEYDNAWGIGSRGLPGESAYHRPDGSRG